MAEDVDRCSGAACIPSRDAVVSLGCCCVGMWNWKSSRTCVQPTRACSEVTPCRPFFEKMFLGLQNRFDFHLLRVLHNKRFRRPP